MLTWPNRHEERMVAIGGRHDVGAGVLAERAEGRRVGAEIRRDGGHGGGGRRFERGAAWLHMGCEQVIAHAAVMG